jgi:hypothetical protein
MGLCVFLLICGPATALLYFPLTTRKQGFHLTPAVVSQTPADFTSARNGSGTIGWIPTADQHSHQWKSAA